MIDRVWLPSPATVIGRPVRACVAKAGIARPSFGRIRGPWVLKIRTIAVSTPCVRR